MTHNQCNIDGRTCHVITIGSCTDTVIIKPLGEFERRLLLQECEMIHQRAEKDFIMVAFEVTEKDLRPDRAEDTFLYMKDSIIPAVKDMAPLAHIVIGGYSLGGLFALKSATRLEGIDAVYAGSPSLWIDGWDEYADAHPLKARYACMSLGDTEECTRKMPYTIIGDRVRRQHERHVALLGTDACTLQWNTGGHFNDIESRKADGFAWCLKQITL